MSLGIIVIVIFVVLLLGGAGDFYYNRQLLARPWRWPRPRTHHAPDILGSRRVQEYALGHRKHPAQRHIWQFSPGTAQWFHRAMGFRCTSLERYRGKERTE